MTQRLKTIAPKVRLIQTTRLKPPGRTGSQLPLYQSAEWRSFIERIKARRGNRCEDPEHDPASPRSGIRIYGDHMIELADGGEPFDSHNIMLRCGRCHGRKTVAARKARR